MPHSPPLVFGKSGSAHARPGAAGSALLVPNEHADFFASVRAELVEQQDHRRMVVPRSFKAAFLAGLVVGCALAGFDVTAKPAEPASLAAVAKALGVSLEASPFDLTPALILLGLFGGARIAAMTVIVVQTLLNWADLSGRIAYAVGGAAMSAIFAGATLVALDHPPAHGWAIELAAGAACGLLYRVLAGRVPAA